MTLRLVCVATLLAAVTACSSTPKENTALNLARANFEAAENDAEVSSLAADELKLADKALTRAELELKKGTGAEVVNHLAYMTSQRVAIALETAASRRDQARVVAAAGDRDRALLARRTHEVGAVRQELALAKESTAIRSAELARAGQQLALARQGSMEKSGELARAGEAHRLEQERRTVSENRVADLESELLALKELNAKQTDRGIVVTFGDVMFESGKSQVLAGATGTIEKLAAFFRNNAQRNALIEGHTDSVGNARANYLLSEKRALAVRDALVQRGVAITRLSTRAYGAEKPVADNATASGRQMNRRVEVVFENTGEQMTSQ
jgi:outer membrane protein OmpA-like peptidoglycan-associated protein